MTIEDLEKAVAKLLARQFAQIPRLVRGVRCGAISIGRSRVTPSPASLTEWRIRLSTISITVTTGLDPAVHAAAMPVAYPTVLRHRTAGAAIPPLPSGERSAAKRPGEGDGALQQRARKLRANRTSAEAVLWKVLRNRQLARWKFRRQYPVDCYIVDFVTIAGRLIVEVDGATHSTVKKLAKDAERTRILNSLGFHLVRVTNVKAYENLDGVRETILQHLIPSDA